MVQFAIEQLKEYSKESYVHASFLFVTLRFLAQLLKTLSVAVESSSSVKADGESLFSKIFRGDVSDTNPYKNENHNVVQNFPWFRFAHMRMKS